MSASVWAPGTSINANSSIKAESFTATAGQTLFTLTEFTYAVGTGSLYVFVAGGAQRPGVDVLETGVSSFTLSTGAPEGAIVLALGFIEVSAVLNQTTVVTQKNIATAGQTLITLTQFTYELGGNHLHVFRNGLLQYLGDDYTETSANSYTFVSPLALNDKIISVSNLFVTDDEAAQLRSDLLSSDGSTLVSTLLSGTGAVTRSIYDKLAESVSVKDFGAVGDGVADDAAAIQSAVNAAVTLGGTQALHFPAGTYLINTKITVNGGLKITGDGNDVSTIRLNTATMIGLDISAVANTEIRDLRITTSATASAGCGIKVASSGGVANTRARISNVVTVGMWRGIDMESAEGWIIENCGIFGIIDVGINISNLINADGGDNWVNNCYFAGGTATSDSIRHQSGGGLQISKCKFQQSGTAYHMVWNSTTGSSQLSLVGNHVEAQLTSSFTFERIAASGGITGISITDNYFSNFNNLLIPNIWFKTNSATTVANVTISGNTHYVGTIGTAIQIDGGTLYTIIGESIQGAVATSVGIATGNATATGIYVDQNHFYNVTTTYSIISEAQIDRNAITTPSITAGYFITESAIGVAAASGVATTLKTFAASPQVLGIYMFEVDLAQGSNANAAWSMIAVGSAGITIMRTDAGAAISIGVSGLNLQCTQTTGVAQTVTWRLVKFGI